MNKPQSITLALALASAAFTHPTSAQLAGFNLNWNTLDGGGGLSSGVTYSVHGTFAQVDAGNFSSAFRALDSGFWYGVGAEGPVLSIRRAGANVILCWPACYAGYQLQEATMLQTQGTTWMNVSQEPVLVNDRWEVTLPASGAALFFRLRRP